MNYQNREIFKHNFVIFVLFLFLIFGLSDKTLAFYEDAPARQVDTASAVKFTDAQTNYLGGTALDSTGKVWTWGWNGTQKTTESGMLGIQDKNGDVAVKSYAGGMIRVPYFVENSIKVEQIEAGYHTTYAIDDKGKVYAWGLGTYNQIGDGVSNHRNPRPICISDVSNSPIKNKKIIKVTTSSEISTLVTALDDQGNVYGWGRAGQSDFPGLSAKIYLLPTELPEIKQMAGNVIDIEYGRAHGLALNDQGKVYVWGTNNKGQHGNGKTSIYPKDHGLEEVKWFSDNGIKIKKISSTSEFNLALDENGNVYQFGEMRSGNQYTVPTKLEYDMTDVGYIPEAKQITAGKLVSYMIDQHGRLWSWGDNNYFGFFLDGPWFENKKLVTDVAKIQPSQMGDGDTEGYAREADVKTPVFSSKTKPILTLSRYESNGSWSNIDKLHPSIYDKKYMKTVGEFTGKNSENHSKVFPVDKKGRKLVYTVQQKNKVYEGKFLVATNAYQGNWYLDISSKETNPLPEGLTSEVSHPEVKESEKSWIGLSVDLDTFDYTANHMQSVPYMTNIHTFQSGSMLLDSAGNLYKSSLDGSGSIAWGWDVNYAYDDGGFSVINPQDGLYNYYNYELTFMRGAPRIIPGAISIENTIEKEYLSDNKVKKVDMKLDIGMAYNDPQLNITIEPSVKQVKAITMPLDQSSEDYKIKSPSYVDFMNAYNQAEERGYTTSDIAKKNNWEGLTHHLGEPAIDTLVDSSIEVTKNSVVWIMLQTETYSNTPTVLKRIEFDNFYDDVSIKSEGSLLDDQTATIYDALPDNVLKVDGSGNKDKYGFPLDVKGNIIKEPTFGFDKVKVKKIENERLDQLDKKPKFSHRYIWADKQATEKVYTLNGVNNIKNTPNDRGETKGELPVLKEFNHKFYYTENPDIYYNLHYVAVDKDGKKLPVEEFALPSELHILKEIEMVRTVPELNINKKMLPNKYFMEHSAPKDTIDVAHFEKLPENRTIQFTIPFDKTIKDVTLYYLYDKTEKDVTLNIRQVIQGESKVEVPKTGYVSYQKTDDKWNKQPGVNQVKVPSGLENTDVLYKTIKTKVNNDSSRFVLKDIVPQYYEYSGFKQSATKESNQSAQLQTEKDIKIDYSDDSTEKWVTVYLKPTTKSPLNYSWETISNKFGNLFVQIRLKFYSKVKEEKKEYVNLDLKTIGNGVLSSYYHNLDDYYMRFEIPGAYQSKKYKSNDVTEDVILDASKVEIAKLPSVIPMNYYYTDSNGNEVESKVKFGYSNNNGIVNPEFYGGYAGFVDLRAVLDKDEIDTTDSNEIVLWYQVQYTSYIVTFP